MRKQFTKITAVICLLALVIALGYVLAAFLLGGGI